MKTESEMLADIKKHLSNLNPENIEHLERMEKTGSLESLEHVQQVIRNLAAKQLASPYAPKHHTSFALSMVRTLKVGNVELVDASGNRINLYVPTFELADFANGANYQQTISQLGLPSTVILLSVAAGSDNKSLVLTFADAATKTTTQETIQIGMAGQDNYLTLLSNTQSTFFTLTKPKMLIDNSLQNNTFNQAIYVVRKKTFGGIEQSNLIPSMYAPQTLANPLVQDISEEFEVDNEKGVVWQMSPNVKAGPNTQANGQSWTLTVNCFSNHTDKTAEHSGLRK